MLGGGTAFFCLVLFCFEQKRPRRVRSPGPPFDKRYNSGIDELLSFQTNHINLLDAQTTHVLYLTTVEKVHVETLALKVSKSHS